MYGNYQTAPSPSHAAPRKIHWLRAPIVAAVLVLVLWSLSVASPIAGVTGPQNASAQATIQCPNGQFVPPGQGCIGGQQPYGCPGIGISLPAGQCPTVCPNGQIAGPGQQCPGGGYPSQQYSCPITVPYGTACPNGYSTQTVTCPGSSIAVPAGTPCPNGQLLCPGTTVTVPPGSACPNGQIPCPGTSVTVPYGTPCPGYCPGAPYAAAPQSCGGVLPGTQPPPAPPTPAGLIPGPATYTITASYAAGWNIVAGPGGSSIPGLTGTLYTLQPGDVTYEVIPVTAPLKPGAGYWAFTPAPVSGALTPTAPTTVTVQLPARQYIMIGNPGNTVATVSGADVVLVYNPSNGQYTQTTQLLPGQGGWAGSVRGGPATITNAAS